jgi:hypothetical protein
MWRPLGIKNDDQNRFVLNGSEHTDGCNCFVFPNATCFIFCVVGGRTAVDGGSGTRKNIPGCAHERQNNRTATSLRLLCQASANIMDLDFEIFDSERLITEVEKRPALYKILVDYHLGSSPNGLDAPGPYKWALCDP